MYDELAIVVEKDMTIGSFAKSYIDLDLKQENVDDTENVADNGEDGVVDKGKNVVQSSTIGSTISKSRKRSYAPLSDDFFHWSLWAVKEIVVVLKSIN